MGLLSRIRSVLSRKPRTTSSSPWSRRGRWDGARTDRLNDAQWSRAHDQTINAALSDDLETLRTRCRYEAANNAFVDGVISTHVSDLVGRDGPTLQVQSDSRAFNEAIEDVWSSWWALPDLRGILSGPDLLSLWIRYLWHSGEYLFETVTTDDEGVSFRLNTIDPERLRTPSSALGDRSTCLGIRHDSLGRPVRYFFVDPSAPSDVRSVDAENIWHRFRTLETGQFRGVPILAPALPAISDLRAYDEQTLDAARAAADWAVILTTDSPDSTFVETNECIPIERRSIQTAPPGWSAHQMRPEQPTTRYVDFRHERLAEIGRPVGMPGMHVRLDSSDSNYSSARYDGANYERSNGAIQGWLERTTLDRLVDLVVAETVLARRIERPSTYRLVWIWPRLPHVDPAKEANAEQTRLGNMTETITEALATRGIDRERHFETLAQEIAALGRMGLLHPALRPNVGGSVADLAEVAEGAADNVSDVVLGRVP